MKTLILAFLLMLFSAQASAVTLPADELQFDVFLDGKEIGYHRFEFDRIDNGALVRSEAEFKVKVLFVTAFRYQHQNKEVWEDNCLRSIDAETDSNGREYDVKGIVENGQFLLQTDQGPQPVDQCVASFAYWDRDRLLSSDRLLNSQTGDYLDIEVAKEGSDAITIGERQVPVEKLRITSAEIDITVLYDNRTGEWVGLESRLENGRTLSYRRDASYVATRVSLR